VEEIMTTFRSAVLAMLVPCLLTGGCATSPEALSREQALQAGIASVLANPPDPAVYGSVKRCLSDNEYRSYRVLDDRHMLFAGRSDRQWINTLRSSCPELGRPGVLVIEPFSARRICANDHFQVADWFAWPWYRRWPWQWRSWSMMCTMGTFQPISSDQLARIESLLDANQAGRALNR
jgi:hypothetical protein